MKTACRRLICRHFVTGWELCLTRRDLERLHDWLCRSVPVSERKPWLDELNVREEQLLARWYDEKRYL